MQDTIDLAATSQQTAGGHKKGEEDRKLFGLVVMAGAQTLVSLKMAPGQVAMFHGWALSVKEQQCLSAVMTPSVC